MSENQQQDWSNYWQGRASTQSSDTIVGVGVEQDADIAAFWNTALDTLPKSAKLLDMACGAGSVIRQAEALGFTHMHGADISKSALAVLKENYPSVETHCVAAENTRLDGESFDVIVSQFGFEYGGAYDAGQEIERLLKPGGTFIAMVHKHEGAIAQEVSGHLAVINAIKDTDFVAKAQDVFNTLFRLETNGRSHDPEGRFSRVSAAFAPAQAELLEIAKVHKGLAAHLYAGTQALYQKRKSYDLEDITAWLDKNGSELEAYHGRMQSMLDAAQSEAEIKSLCDNFPGKAEYKVLELGDPKQAAAWTITAVKDA